MFNKLRDALSGYKNKTRHIGLRYYDGELDVYVCKEFPVSSVFTSIIVDQVCELREEHGLSPDDRSAYVYLSVLGDKIELSVCFCDGGLFSRMLTSKHFPVIDKI